MDLADALKEYQHIFYYDGVKRELCFTALGEYKLIKYSIKRTQYYKYKVKELLKAYQIGDLASILDLTVSDLQKIILAKEEKRKTEYTRKPTEDTRKKIIEVYYRNKLGKAKNEKVIFKTLIEKYGYNKLGQMVGKSGRTIKSYYEFYGYLTKKSRVKPFQWTREQKLLINKLYYELIKAPIEIQVKGHVLPISELNYDLIVEHCISYLKKHQMIKFWADNRDTIECQFYQFYMSFIRFDEEEMIEYYEGRYIEQGEDNQEIFTHIRKKGKQVMTIRDAVEELILILNSVSIYGYYFVPCRFGIIFY